MERHINEADWKLLRRLEPVALERFCQRSLSDVVRLATDDLTSTHKRYLAVFHLIRDRNGEMADCFDGLRRSTALVQLARMRSLGLITDEEFAGFTAETQAAVSSFPEMWRE